TLEMIEWVFPEHAGGPGQIHGGGLMGGVTKGGGPAPPPAAPGAPGPRPGDEIDLPPPATSGPMPHLTASVRDSGPTSPRGGGGGAGVRRGRGDWRAPGHPELPPGLREGR